MSFANPGSRQASSVGSLRRRLEPLPGNYVTSPWHLPRHSAHTDYSYLNQFGVTGYGAQTTTFWDNLNYMGAWVSGTIALNATKTIIDINGASGVVGNIIFPAIMNFSDVMDHSITVDGREYRWTQTAPGALNRVLFGPTYDSFGADPWVTSSSNSNGSENFGPWSSAADGRVPYKNSVDPHNIFPVPHLMTLRAPLLYFKNSLKITCTPRTVQIVDGSQNETRGGVTYSLEPRG